MSEEQKAAYSRKCFNCGHLFGPDDFGSWFEDTLYHTRDDEELCKKCGLEQSENNFIAKWGVPKPSGWDKHWSATDKSLWETRRELELMKQKRDEETATKEEIHTPEYVIIMERLDGLERAIKSLQMQVAELDRRTWSSIVVG